MDDRDRKRRSAANAVGGSTARACDGCVRRRARWYCGADDAFLCQACDSSVHSANSLARRHQRLRLHTSSFPSSSSSAAPPPISWRRRKARTPRPHKPVKTEPLVPDLEDEEEDLEMQLTYCVPALDPLFDDFSFEENTAEMGVENNLDVGLDVECMLDVEEDSNCVDAFDVGGEEDVKMEFDFGAVGDGEKKGEWGGGVGAGVGVKKMGLRLDYDAVIDAWAQSGCSTWTACERPQIDCNGCLPSSGMVMSEFGGAKWSRGRWGASEGGEEREARVTRYREKRRTRLFSKKIRYEVRKLNAEKRPRMKGRFVKRTALSTGPGQAHCQY